MRAERFVVVSAQLADAPDAGEAIFTLANTQARDDLVAYLSNDQDYSRYSEVLNYLVRVENRGSSPARNIDLAVLLSEGLDEAHATWICTGPASSGCTAQGTGPLFDSGLTLESNQVLTYLFSVPVKNHPNEDWVEAELQVVSDAGTDSAIDHDTLVLLRTGFESAAIGWLHQDETNGMVEQLRQGEPVRVDVDANPTEGIALLWRGRIGEQTNLALDRLHLHGQSWWRLRYAEAEDHRVLPWFQAARLTLWLDTDGVVRWSPDGTARNR